MSASGGGGPAGSPEASDEDDLATVRIGSVVDRYEIVRLLGRGGMGAVYEARHTKLARRCAIKFLLPRVAANPDVLRRFENEAKAAGGLEHPNLAAVTDVGCAADGAPFLVMEYLDGEDCGKLLGRVGPLPPARAANIVLQACRGLAVAHKVGIVHRDLKPANLFLTDAGDGRDLVKVLDFGIAKLRLPEATVATGTGETFGTAHYMSPEQARAAADVDARTDVWALGVVLYEFLAGRRPFEDGAFLNVIYQILSSPPPPLGALRPDVPAALVAIVERAMAKDVDRRYPSVIAFGEALGAFLDQMRSVSSSSSSQRAGGTAARPQSAATVLTPATGIHPGGGDGAGTGAGPGTDTRRQGPLLQPSVDVGPRPPRTRRGLGFAAVLLVAAAGGAVFIFAGWHKPGGEPGRQANSVVAPAVPSHQASAVARPPAPALVPTPLPTPPATGPSPLPEVDRPRTPASSTKTVRTSFEHASNSRRAHREAVPSRAAPLAVPDPAPRAPVVAPRGLEHPLDIDETSPYEK